jgi:hypothetical protein
LFSSDARKNSSSPTSSSLFLDGSTRFSSSHSLHARIHLRRRPPRRLANPLQDSAKLRRARRRPSRRNPARRASLRGIVARIVVGALDADVDDLGGLGGVGGGERHAKRRARRGDREAELAPGRRRLELVTEDGLERLDLVAQRLRRRRTRRRMFDGVSYGVEVAFFEAFVPVFGT